MNTQRETVEIIPDREQDEEVARVFAGIVNSYLDQRPDALVTHVGWEDHVDEGRDQRAG